MEEYPLIGLNLFSRFPNSAVGRDVGRETEDSTKACPGWRQARRIMCDGRSGTGNEFKGLPAFALRGATRENATWDG